MIRSNTPHPYLYRQRDARTTDIRTTRERTRVVSRPPSGVPRSARDRRKLVTYSHASAPWAEFLDMYETFTDILCAAAKTGCNECLEREYVAVRWWFLQQYPHHAHHVRRLIGGSAAFAHATHPTVTDMTTGEKRRMDSFESLFIAKTLREVLAGDRGGLISQVSAVSHALYQAVTKTKQ